MLLQASPHPVAMDWQYRAAANAGNTHNLHRDAASLLLNELISSGVENELAEIYPFLGDTLGAVFTKLKRLPGLTGYCSNNNWVASNILAFGGLKDASNTSKKLGVGLAISTVLTGKESSAGCHWYTRDTGASGTSQVAIGSTNTGTVNFLAGWVNSGSRENGTIANATATTAGSTVSVKGFQGALNMNSRTTQYFLNGVATGTSASAAGSGAWTTSSNYQIFANGNTNYWKRDMLYADLSVGLTVDEEPQLARSVLKFQRFLNRA